MGYASSPAYQSPVQTGLLLWTKHGLYAAGFITGEVAEWSIATVLKTVDPQGSVGSNPTLSAN